jgi:predicted nucleotidyltransferase
LQSCVRIRFGENCDMSVAELPLQIDRQQIAHFCRARGIRKLSVFGSVLRADFNPQHSDVDVLAEFEPEVLKRAGFQYFGYGQELAAILGNKVDFCSRLHPLIFARVKKELLPVYERA